MYCRRRRLEENANKRRRWKVKRVIDVSWHE